MTLLFDTEGSLLWETFSDDPAEAEVPTDLRADLFGVVYLTGKSQSGGNGQYLTLRYDMLPISPQPVPGPTGKASHVANEVLVRFDPSVVDPAFVDNREMNFGRVDEIITDPALISLMDSKLQANGQLGGWTLSRIFHSLDSQDETMTSVLGKTVELPKLWSALRLHIPPSSQESLTDEHEVADSLSTLPLRYIRYAHPSYYAHLQACAPNDPLYSSQLSLNNSDPIRSHINAEQAWCLLDSMDEQKGKSSVRVGIFDTGISASHPDFVFGGGGFAGSIVDLGERFFNGTQVGLQYSDPDLQGHGSKSSGIIAAIRNNGTGVAGIAGGDVGKGEGEGVHLVNVQTFFVDQLGNASAKIPDLADAFVWALTAGPNNSPLFEIANHGYGFFLNDIQVNQPNVDLYREVWQMAFRAEVTSVVSRGNAFQTAPTAASSIPATFTIDSIQEPSFYFDDWNLSVGASNSFGEIQIHPSQFPNNDQYSSYFKKSVDLLAPGISHMLETTNHTGGYSDFNGTSASAPHVSGAAALLMSYSDVALAPEDVEHLLEYGAVPKNNVDSAGWGLLDAYATLKLIEQPEYRVLHFDTLLTSGAFPATPGTIPIRLTSDYDTISAGIYQANVYQYVASFSYNLGTGVSLAALPPNKPPYWVRNSGSRLWGPNGTLQGGSSQYVVPVDRVSFFGTPTVSSASVSGYYYEIFLSSTESVVIPYGADTSAQMAFSLLAYNPEGFTTNVEESFLDKGLSLHIFPNPTTEGSTLSYELAKSADVQISLTDLSGRILWQNHSGRKPQGIHRQEVPSHNLSTGLYLLQFQADGYTSFVKLIKQ